MNLERGATAFWRDGYAVRSDVFTPTEVAELQTHFDDVLAGRYDRGQAPHAVDNFVSMRKVSNAHWADTVIHRAVLHPVIAETAAALLGVDELYLWADSLYWKAPLAAAEEAVIGWHQDKQYWAASDTTEMITACIALYDADATSGGLRFAAGSHEWGLVGGSDAFAGPENRAHHHRPPVPPGRRWREECPSVAAGGVTFHHSLTFHGSGPNLSEQTRRSITVHMVSGRGRCARPFDDPSLAAVKVGDPFRPPLFPRLWPAGG